MKTIIDKEEHTVVYIDYNKGLPFKVVTICFIKTSKNPYWRQYDWSFFPNNGDKTDLRAYNNGSGGNEKEIHAPQWVNGYLGEYWVSKNIKMIGKIKNGKRLKKPKSIKCYYQHNQKKSINPFKCAEITHSYEYCEECEAESTEYCEKHRVPEY